jgi:hypothetical protein
MFFNIDFATAFPEIEELKLELEGFQERTKKTILNNIYYGNRIIISRAIESNVGKAFPSMPKELHDAKENGKEPIIELYLSPVDSLGNNAMNESNKLGRLKPKKDFQKGINNERGLSYVGHITQLRWLWLYTGTITFAYALSKCYPNNFYFYFGNQIPSARCTLVEEKPSEEKPKPGSVPCYISKTHYVQLFEYDIGLDSRFYNVVGKDEFKNKLWKEFAIGRNSNFFNEEKFFQVFFDAEDIEKKIFNDDNNIVNGLKQIKYKQLYPIEKEYQVPSVVTKWKDYFLHLQKIPDSQINLSELQGNIMELQKDIDTDLLLNLKKVME